MAPGTSFNEIEDNRTTDNNGTNIYWIYTWWCHGDLACLQNNF